MSVVTRAACPHECGVFVWLGDGPWLGDPADPDYGGYPWVHDTTKPGDHGHLGVCELMAFATPEQAGEVCACGHSAGRHAAVPGPIPAGRLACPRPCDCGCPDFSHWAEGKPMWSVSLSCGCGFLAHYVPKPGVGAYVSCTSSLRHQTSYRIVSVTQVSVEAKPAEGAAVATERPPAGPAVQLELFAVEPMLARPAHGLGPRGFPMCSACKTRESIGPRHVNRLDLCTHCWPPALDPIGAAGWDRIRAEGRRVETVLVSGGVL